MRICHHPYVIHADDKNPEITDSWFAIELPPRLLTLNIYTEMCNGCDKNTISIKIFSVKMTVKVWNNQVKYTYRVLENGTPPVGGSEYAAFTRHVV